MQSSNLSSIVEPKHRRQRVKLIVCLEKVQLALAQYFFWFATFRSGDFNLENKPRKIPQPKVNNDELKAIIECDTPQITRELAQKIGFSITTISDYSRQINIVKKLDRWVPHKLNAHQVKKRFDGYVSLLSRNQGKPFLHRIVTCNDK